VLEDHQHAEMFVGREAMLGSGFDEDRGALSDGNLFSLDFEDACALEDDVELVVLVRLLPIGLRRDETVDPDLEAGGLVDDLVATAGLTKPFLDGCDLERVHATNLLHPHSQA
jgi:hypothetical protein